MTLTTLVWANLVLSAIIVFVFGYYLKRIGFTIQSILGQLYSNGDLRHHYSVNYGPNMNEVFPEVTAHDKTSSTILLNYANKDGLILFTESGCPECLRTLRGLHRYNHEMLADDITILSYASSSPDDDLKREYRKLLQELPFANYKIDERVLIDLNILRFPTLIRVKDGIVIGKYSGLTESLATHLEFKSFA